MKKYTIEEIKNYIKQQDSLGDVMFYLSEENIEKANEKFEKHTPEVDYTNHMDLKWIE